VSIVYDLMFKVSMQLELVIHAIEFPLLQIK